jgi:hypothetical protein
MILLNKLKSTSNDLCSRLKPWYNAFADVKQLHGLCVCDLMAMSTYGRSCVDMISLEIAPEDVLLNSIQVRKYHAATTYKRGNRTRIP